MTWLIVIVIVYGLLLWLSLKQTSEEKSLNDYMNRRDDLARTGGLL